MESNGIEGEIIVSESTKNLIERNQEFSFIMKKHKVVSIQSLNKEIAAYLLQVV